jgi:hypothetical protein
VILPIQIWIDGTDRATGLQLRFTLDSSTRLASASAEFSDLRRIAQLRSVLEAIRAGRSLEVRVPDLDASERFSVANASEALKGFVDGCRGTSLNRPGFAGGCLV